jgi:hypothetical protein
VNSSNNLTENIKIKLNEIQTKYNELDSKLKEMIEIKEKSNLKDKQISILEEKIRELDSKN